MISEETNKYQIIDTLIRQGRSFAIYRIPGEDSPKFVMQASGSACLLYDIEDLNEQQGFVIAPFRVSRDCPIVLIRRDYSELPESCPNDSIRMDLEFHPNETEISSERKTKDNYTQCFGSFIQPLQEKTLDKLVLSRSLTLDRKASFSPAKAFYKACEQYIRSYVYLCHTPQTGWEEHPKLFSPESKANGTQSLLPEHSLCKTGNCRPIGTKRTYVNNS